MTKPVTLSKGCRHKGSLKVWFESGDMKQSTYSAGCFVKTSRPRVTIAMSSLINQRRMTMETIREILKHLAAVKRHAPNMPKAILARNIWAILVNKSL